MPPIGRKNEISLESVLRQELLSMKNFHGYNSLSFRTLHTTTNKHLITLKNIINKQNQDNKNNETTSDKKYENSEKFALAQDGADPLAKYRSEFLIPRAPDGKDFNDMVQGGDNG